MIAQLVTERPLLRGKVAEDRLLELRGKVRGDLPLGAAQDEGPEGGPEDRSHLVARLGGLLQERRAAEQAGVQEVEEALQLAEVVLDRRAGESETVIRLQQARRLRRLRPVVLDGLGFVEDDVVEGHAPKEQHVAPQGAVGRQHDVDAFQPVRLPAPVGPGVVEQPEGGGEARRFLLPVEDQGLRDHDERWLPCRSPASLEQGQHLHRLAQAHVVGEAAPESELAEEMHPPEPFVLVAPQVADEPGRSLRGPHALELAETLPGACESGVHRHLGLGGQQGIEHARLAAAETDDLALGGSEVGQKRLPPQPLLGQQTHRAVVEGHRLLAAPEGREESGQRHGSAVEVDAAFEVEPIDAARNAQAGLSRRAEDLPLGLHPPALRHQGGHDLGQEVRVDPQVANLPAAVDEPAHAHCPEPLDRAALRFHVPDQHAPLFRLVDAPARRPLGQEVVPVLERELARQCRPAPRREQSLHLQGRARASRLFFVGDGRRQVDPWPLTRVGECIDEPGRLGIRDREGGAAQVDDPRKRAAVVEPGRAVLEEDEAALGQERGLREGPLLVAPAEAALDRQPVGSAPHFEPKLPGRPVVPGEMRRVEVVRPPAEPAAAGRAEQGNDHRRERLGKAVATRGSSVGFVHPGVAAVFETAQEHRERPTIADFRHAARDLPADLLRLGLAPPAALARLPMENVDDEAPPSERRLDVDVVEKLPARGPRAIPGVDGRATVMRYPGQTVFPGPRGRRLVGRVLVRIVLEVDLDVGRDPLGVREPGFGAGIERGDREVAVIFRGQKRRPDVLAGGAAGQVVGAGAVHADAVACINEHHPIGPVAPNRGLDAGRVALCDPHLACQEIRAATAPYGPRESRGQELRPAQGRPRPAADPRHRFLPQSRRVPRPKPGTGSAPRRRSRPSARAQLGLGGALGVRHEADHVARLGLHTPAMARALPFDVGGVVEAAVPRRVAEHDLAFTLEPVELVVGKVEVPLAVGDGHGEHGARRRGRRWRWCRCAPRGRGRAGTGT